MTTNTVSTTSASERSILGFLADSQCEVISGGVVGTLRRRVVVQSNSATPAAQPSSANPANQSPFPTPAFSAIPDFGQLVPSFGGEFPSFFNGITI
jgi:hypothetical protein